MSHRIGEAIARGDYKAAVKMLLRSQGENRARLKQVGEFDHVPAQQDSRKPSAYTWCIHVGRVVLAFECSTPRRVVASGSRARLAMCELAQAMYVFRVYDLVFRPVM